MPGYAIGELTQILGWRQAPTDRRLCLALVFAFATIPALDSVTARLVGLPAAGVLNVALTAAGMATVVRRGGAIRLSGPWLAAAAAWLVVIISAFIDFDWGGGLWQPLLTVDEVKHAAVIQAIGATGAPPIDPFFARPSRSGYYYFFYTVPAILVKLTRGVIDARAAFAGMVFWTGPALLILTIALGRSSNILNDRNERRLRWIVLLLLCCTGLDLIGMAACRAAYGFVYQQIDWWNPDEVTSWVSALLWTPHHVTALIASWVGFAALAELAVRPVLDRKPSVTLAALAGLAFATSFGTSVWVTVPTVVTVACWTAGVLPRKDWRLVGWSVAAGVLALAIDAPAIIDLVHGRAQAGTPVAIEVRHFMALDLSGLSPVARGLVDVAWLPVNYGLEFGIFALGSWMFWARRVVAARTANEMSGFLTLSAVVGVLIATFLRSTVINNDLGYRAMLFPQLAALLWTAAALDEATRRTAGAPDATNSWFSRLPTAAGLALIIGFGGVAYTLIANRLPAAYFWPAAAFRNAHPNIDRDTRAAYEWANEHLARGLVLQHNPLPARTFDFGLYSNNPVGVSDGQAQLFGAADSDVRVRRAALGPIFAAALPSAAVRDRARTAGVDALVVSSDDPAWARPTSWVWTSPAVFHNEHVRIILVRSVGSGAE